MQHSFLLIGNMAESQWPLLLEMSLAPLGKLRIIQEEEAVEILAKHRSDVVIIDAGVVSDVPGLVSSIYTRYPESRIVVVTASPTWQRAREALHAGAADYIRKSLDKDELLSKIKAVLALPPPVLPC